MTVMTLLTGVEKRPGKTELAPPEVGEDGRGYGNENVYEDGGGAGEIGAVRRLTFGGR